MELRVKKNSSTSSFKLPAAFTAALAICALIFAVDLSLPKNAFTHRVWEALIVHQYHSLLPGPFYPKQKMSMEEQGDLAPYTRFSVKKRVTWETDRYGFRKKDSSNQDYDTVIVGDSTTIGTGLDQPDMLSEKLENILQKPVYPFAPYYEMDTYLESAFYKEHPPRRVIFSMMEWAIPDLIENEAKLAKRPKAKNPSNCCEGLGIALDRVSKMSFLRFLTARVKGMIKNRSEAASFRTVQTDAGWMIFPEGKSAHREIPLSQVQRIIPVLKRYQETLKSRGIEMIFLPVPNKESLYYKMIPGRQVSIFYLTLAEAAREAGIPTLNLLEYYANVQFKDQTLLYHLDDSHWNRYGTQLAAEGLAQMIEPKKSARDRASVR